MQPSLHAILKMHRFYLIVTPENQHDIHIPESIFEEVSP